MKTGGFSLTSRTSFFSFSSSLPLEHRALTTSFHLSLAALFASSQVMLMVFNSACWVLFACLLSAYGMSNLSPLSLLWMVSVMGSCPVLRHSSWLEMRSGHLMHGISDGDRCWWRPACLSRFPTHTKELIWCCCWTVSVSCDSWGVYFS